MAQKTIMVEGMTCEHCRSAVEGALSGLEGVDSASVDLDANKVDVQYDESQVTESAMNEAIEDQGYNVSA
ncbi:copper chaperone CopZ [Salinicoccus sp. ID82-1]|uniref:Copper chaperone CopZ n=1 Tax=Salinicoccus cyprini TaxID=2493691 RepID=A0A558ASR9_9STAP|nr:MULTISPECIES: copper chaperone CopZ [Salinicoccus]MCG1009820.1 copper chaperone CopZ [Salinicoccus sp. ID82-1]TVT27313.1 copper chaperone CopZ [Salinicoccus cyprini]